MDVKGEIVNCFQFMGQKLPEKVLNKCVEMCITYDISPEEFVDHWSAFSITNLKSAPPSLDGIQLMERKEFAGLKKKNIDSAIEKLHISESQEEHSEVTPKKGQLMTPKRKRIGSPDRGSKRYLSTPESSPSASPSRESQSTPTSSQASPSVEESGAEYVPHASYIDRTDAGSVSLAFGKSIEFTPGNTQVTVQLFGKDVIWHEPQNFFYMEATQSSIADAYSMHIDSVATDILKKYNLDAPEMFGTSTVDDMIIHGRIKGETNARLNGNTVFLEGSYDFNAGRTTELNIGKTPSYSLFPGQVVAVQGTNVLGSSFVPRKFYIDSSNDFIQETPKWTENMQIVVAAGPFTICDNLLYEPLQDLLKYVVENKPHVLILMGPFIDITQSAVREMNETFGVYFTNLMDNIMECLKGLRTKVVLVPSQKDAHHHMVYPTPSYVLKQNYPNLLCAPDPCMINVDGLIIAATTIDILFHLTKQEISRRPQNNDRMSRLASHLISQRSFYPLYPPEIRTSIDPEIFLTNCEMDVIPHILILPSTLRHCVKNVEKCLVVNPERLVKSYVGGTFAVIDVSPATEPGSMIDYLSCQIKKI